MALLTMRKCKRIRLACIYIISLLSFYQEAFSQDTQLLIDSIAKAHFADTTNAGLSIGIIKNGKAHGYYFGGKYTSCIKDVDSSSLFEIGSVTKTYTCFILASLEAEKKLSRFDLLSKYLPKEITAGKKWASTIRLVDLATHTSGLPQFDNTKSLAKLEGFDENNPYGLFTEKFMLAVLKNTDTLSGYGKINYSNFGMGILGYAMAKATALSFENLFEKYIVEAIGLKNTFVTVKEEHLTNIAIPHRKLETMPLIQLAGLSPSGAVKTTMPDLLKFVDTHLQKTPRFLKAIQTALADQQTDKEKPIGLGWGIHTIKNETVYFHNGGTYGSSSIVIMVPSRMSAVAILANNSSESQLTSYALKIVNQLID